VPCGRWRNGTLGGARGAGLRDEDSSGPASAGRSLLGTDFPDGRRSSRAHELPGFFSRRHGRVSNLL